MPSQFDYVIVGGGSAGAVLAARLSENPDNRVCLLEAGGEGRDLLVRMPALTVAMMPGKPMKLNNWAFSTVPQRGLNGRRGYQPRGRTLGGSSAINAMVYTRGNSRDYNRWVELGAEGWSWEEVLPYFRKSESNERGGSDLHGASGPLHVADPSSPRSITKDWIAAGQACQLPLTTDFNGEQQAGIGYYQITQFHDSRRGQRCSTAAAYLHPVMDNRSNLHVITGAHATRVLFSDKRATGVEYLRGGKTLTVEAAKEVILSAGAFQSPQLLMLSGIGPATHLKQHGIPVIHDLPAVGQNLQDHPDVVLSYGVNTTDVFGVGVSGSFRLMGGLREWFSSGKGLLSTNFTEAGAFFSVGDESDDWPNVQLHFVIARVEDHGRKIKPGYGISCHACILRPESRGQVTLASADPMAAPAIDPDFLGDDRDAELLLKAVRKTLEIMESEPIASRINKTFTARSTDSDEALMNMIRNHCDTVYHPIGTCRMGSDQDSVVDTSLRVRGVEGLRVIDASVMPTLISANTNAPTIMIAEKAAAEFFRD
ncbi:GMC family oxidoreductase N-terminal domain-containing protein [Marinobacter sp. S6332]|uniref:GMC family oxidoreductase n=1 Tax=Marinobacter sp. S6332 TaxID=2926403 RepID=UPI001FF2F403|nr:GMC family oxidoreductase N-terminal domain-containing protein [Marinobacter sp. S6332]MCK0165201.1 GMC family oxidoreductase N-terminal domain-containing protein [Marinobacter sp. S6332]